MAVCEASVQLMSFTHPILHNWRLVILCCNCKIFQLMILCCKNSKLNNNVPTNQWVNSKQRKPNKKITRNWVIQKKIGLFHKLDKASLLLNDKNHFSPFFNFLPAMFANFLAAMFLIFYLQCLLSLLMFPNFFEITYFFTLAYLYAFQSLWDLHALSHFNSNPFWTNPFWIDTLRFQKSFQR